MQQGRGADKQTKEEKCHTRTSQSKAVSKRARKKKPQTKVVLTVHRGAPTEWAQASGDTKGVNRTRQEQRTHKGTDETRPQGAISLADALRDGSMAEKGNTRKTGRGQRRRKKRQDPRKGITRLSDSPTQP